MSNGLKAVAGTAAAWTEPEADAPTAAGEAAAQSCPV